MIQCPFQLPLTRDQFADALKRGHGRALMHVRAHGLAGVEDLFLHACAHNLAWDQQCHGARDPWLIEMFVASGDEVRLVPEIVQRVSTRDGDDYDAHQRVGLLMRLAQRGHAEARTALYASLRPLDSEILCRSWPHYIDVVGAAEIVALDGEAGLLHVADWYGRLLLDHPGVELWGPAFHEHLEGDEDGAAAWALLEREARHNANIAAYIDQCRKDEEREATRKQERASTPEKTADEALRIIEASRPGEMNRWLRYWSQRCATAEERLRMFEQMLLTSETDKVCQYIQVVAGGPLPEFDSRLVPFIDHADERVRHQAFHALARYQHPAVRELALSRLRTKASLEGEFGLLVKNFEPGDEALIATALRFPHDELRRDDWRYSDSLDYFHTQMLDLLEVFKAHPDADATPTMLFCCEYLPCPTCRGSAVGILLDGAAAPDWLIEECRYDASDDIRELVAGRGYEPQGADQA